MNPTWKPLALALALLLCVPAGWAGAEKGVRRRAETDYSDARRVALVIGNQAYGAGALDNPANDARDMAAALKSLGFSVTLGIDRNRREMVSAIREFGDRLGEDTVGLFYFSGHGLRVNGRNFLVPVESDIRREDEVPFEAVPADRVLAKMNSAGNPLNLVVLDACRNNPWARSWHKGPADTGLGSMSPPTGTLIFYAAAPGGVAEDGDSNNSPFTASLKERIATPNLPLLSLVSAVAGDVVRNTGGQQNPWMEGMVLGTFYFSEEEEKPDGPGALKIVLQPEVDGAWVRINGRDYGERRQFTINGRGNYRIEVGAEGYRTHRASENLGPGVAKTVTARLEREVLPEPTPEPVRVPAPVAPAVSQGRKPGEIMRGPLGMEFAWIPAGSFMMGSPEDEPGLYDNEKRHRVTLTEGFWMQTTETTQGQWKAVMGTNPSRFSSCGDDCPVEQVSWNDVQEFIEKLNARGEGTYRLPTEAQWEYAARAGTETAYPWGDRDDCSRMMYENDPGSSVTKCVAYVKQRGLTPDSTAPVGSYPANPWGLFDMNGNVWEWCADWYGDYPSGSVTDPTGPSKGSGRILRGGSWRYDAANCRSALRNGDSPGVRYDGLGFRLSRQP